MCRSTSRAAGCCWRARWKKNPNPWNNAYGPFGATFDTLSYLEWGLLQPTLWRDQTAPYGGSRQALAKWLSERAGKSGDGFASGEEDQEMEDGSESEAEKPAGKRTAVAHAHECEKKREGGKWRGEGAMIGRGAGGRA